MTSTVCALVPTFNRASMLRECLDSLLAQTRPLDQILVINDGSTDDTEAIVKSYDGRVILISKPNGGKSSALNLGLQKCTCDYVWICDDDDVAAPEGLSHMVQALDANPHAGFVFGRHKTFRDTRQGRIYDDQLMHYRKEEQSIKIKMLEQMVTFQYAILVRRSLYNEVGAFREDLIRSQDYEMMLRLSYAAEAVQLDEVIFYQRTHEGVRGSTKDPFSAQSSFRKWLTYDQKIFNEIRNKYSLQDFTPSFALNCPEAERRRAALIERACLFAHRALWAYAIQDFEEVAKEPDLILSVDEINVLEIVVVSELAWDDLSRNDAWVEKLRGIYSESRCGKQIVLYMCRPLIWQARQRIVDREFSSFLRAVWLAFRLLGPLGLCRRLWRSFFT